MESSFIVLLLILVIISAFIFSSRSDKFTTSCRKYTKLKKIIPRSKRLIRDNFRDFESKVNAYNKLDNSPMPKGSIIQCGQEVPDTDPRMERSFRTVNEIMNDPYINSFSTNPVFM